MRKVRLTKGYFAIVDNQDYSRVSKHKWQAVESKYTTYAYTSFRGNGKQFKVALHRFILGEEVASGMVVDHKNKNGLDNRRRNIRACTFGQNNHCRSRRSIATSSGYLGILWKKGEESWRCRIGVNGKDIYIGQTKFKYKLPALAKRYNYYALKYYGKFAVLNEL